MTDPTTPPDACQELRELLVGRSVACVECRRTKAPRGRSVPMQGGYCERDCPGHDKAPMPGSLWPGERRKDFGFPEWLCQVDEYLERLVALESALRPLLGSREATPEKVAEVVGHYAQAARLIRERRECWSDKSDMKRHNLSAWVVAELDWLSADAARSDPEERE